MISHPQLLAEKLLGCSVFNLDGFMIKIYVRVTRLFRQEVQLLRHLPLESVLSPDAIASSFFY